MEYMTSKETSELWGIGQGRILRLCREGRIEGAAQFGKSWMIPRGAAKPADGRTRQARNAVRVDDFRFPLFVNAPADSYSPPLTREEQMLRAAQVDFFACRFDKALPVFARLTESAESVYIRLCATAFMAALSACYSWSIDWRLYDRRLRQMLAEDFPHREDMRVLLPWLDCFCGMYSSVAEDYSFDPACDYHPSVQALFGLLSIFLYFPKDISEFSSTCDVTAYEFLCRAMEQSGRTLEAQQLHLFLFISYYYSRSEKPMLHHLRRVLTIAYEHELLFDTTDILFYYSDAFRKVVDEYPAEFIRHVSKTSEKVGRNFARFAKEYGMTEMYSLISAWDYGLMLCVLRGLTNKEISGILKLSEQTVANKLSGIYAKLGIKNRRELIAMMQESMDGKRAGVSENRPH